MIKLIFDLATNRGVSFSRDPRAGEYMRLVAKELCGWFFDTPSRYEWNGTALQEFAGWAAELAAEKLAADKRIMKDAIKGRELNRNTRKIEHPDMNNVFFDPSDRIQRILARYNELLNTDPVPVGGGYWDDIDENPVLMTMGELRHLRNAIIDREEANVIVRKNHIAAMKLLSDPLTYDYTGGWE